MVSYPSYLQRDEHAFKDFDLHFDTLVCFRYSPQMQFDAFFAMHCCFSCVFSMSVQHSPFPVTEEMQPGWVQRPTKLKTRQISQRM